MTEFDGIARSTTQVPLGTVRNDLAAIASLTRAVGDAVLSVCGQAQFQDAVRRRIEAVDESGAMLRHCLDGLGQSLNGDEPAVPVRPAAILDAARMRYLTQIQHRVDAQALGRATPGTDAPDPELLRRGRTRSTTRRAGR